MESNTSKMKYKRNKNKWYLCTRPNKISSKKGIKRESGSGTRPLSIWEKREAKMIPVLLLMDGVHIDNLIYKKHGDIKIGDYYYEHNYAGLIVVEDLECETKEQARKKINKNREYYINKCNIAIEKYKKKKETL